MSHIRPYAILRDPVGTLLTVLEISWRVPLRVLTAIVANISPSRHSQEDGQITIWMAMVSAVFAATLTNNWQLLLSRPRFMEPGTGSLFPPDLDFVNQTDKDHEHGFHGYLYTAKHSVDHDKRTLIGADAVWLHAHGGGFYAGQARQYHHTYLRWVNKAYVDFGFDLRILAVEYPLSTSKPYPGGLDSMHKAYEYCLSQGIPPSRIIIAGDSAGGNLALSTCYRILERPPQDAATPAGLVMLSPWLDLTRVTSGRSKNQSTDWLTTFDADSTKTDCIDVYCGHITISASDARISPLWRKPSPRLPKQYLSAGRLEVLFADAKLWAEKCTQELGERAIETHFAEGQVHTFAIGGWLADTGVESISDFRLLTFVKQQIQPL